MKKLFLLIPAMLLTLAMNAAVINITPTSPYGENDNLRKAVYYAAAGDEIVLADGTYFEPKTGGYLALNKSLTIKAAEGAHPVVQMEAYAQLTAAAKVKFEGITFDGSVQGSYDYYFRAYDVSASSLIFENCEFYDIKNEVFRAKSDVHMDSLIVNNCYFHDNKKNIVYFEASGTEGRQTCDKLVFTNSTVANTDSLKNYTSTIDIRPYGSSVTDAIKVIVDHCTFYNNPTINTDHSSIRPYKLSDVTISNCIFAKGPDQKQKRNATSCYGGSISNCLVYDLDYSSSGHRSDPTVTNNIVANPLFTDAANGDFSFAGNWVTMNLSPARGAATDGSDLGDPRWYSAEILPSTDFAPSYVFLGAKAQLSGSFALNGDSYIQSDGSTTDGLAVWKIQATRKCIVDVTLNIADANTSGHRYEVALYDANNALVGTALAEPENSWSHGDKVLGSFEIPAAGNYTVKLTNDCDYSSTIIEGVTFAYVGGEVQAMPGTTDIDDAWFSSNGTRADGKITYSNIGSGCWAKWNIALADAGTYNVIVNIQNQYGHNYTVEFLKEGEVTPISVSEGETKYGHDETLYPVEVGAIALEAGNYVMTVSNAIGDAKLLSTTLAYAGGAAVDLSKAAPANLLANADAIVSDDWSIEDGKIVHPESKAKTGWAKWNVNSADYGNYNVTVNIASDNGHLVRVEIFEDENAAPIYTLDETSATQYHTGDQAIDLGNVVLDAREYVVKVSNTGEYSHVQIASIVIAYQNGAKQNIPGSITFTDALLSAKAYIENDMLYFAPHDCGTIPDEWAKWNLYVANTDIYQFTVNVTSPNGQKYLFLLKDNNGEEVYKLEHTSSLGSGDKSFTTGLMYLASGDYTLEMRNVYPYSDGHLVSISAAAVAGVLTIDENATDNGVIHDNYRNGNHNIRVIRSIVPDMYNTICLPFDVNSTQLQAIFGSDVELLQMAAATLSGNELTLNFDAVTSIYRGTPYLIKTSKAIVNPIFTEVEIKAEEGSATGGEGFAADFIGNFIKSEVPAGDQNLFLMQDNELFFRQTATPIKGMRAYFHVNVPGAAQAIQRIRIEEAPAITTGINRVDANGSVKTIENGQLVIIKNGVKYNVMGVKLQ